MAATTVSTSAPAASVLPRSSIIDRLAEIINRAEQTSNKKLSPDEIAAIMAAAENDVAARREEIFRQAKDRMAEILKSAETTSVHMAHAMINIKLKLDRLEIMEKWFGIPPDLSLGELFVLLNTHHRQAAAAASAAAASAAVVLTEKRPAESSKTCNTAPVSFQGLLSPSAVQGTKSNVEDLARPSSCCCDETSFSHDHAHHHFRPIKSPESERSGASEQAHGESTKQSTPILSPHAFELSDFVPFRRPTPVLYEETPNHATAPVSVTELEVDEPHSATVITNATTPMNQPTVDTDTDEVSNATSQ